MMDIGAKPQSGRRYLRLGAGLRESQRIGRVGPCIGATVQNYLPETGLPCCVKSIELGVVNGHLDLPTLEHRRDKYRTELFA